MKRQYNLMFKDLLPAYEIDTQHMLDEGTAVIYNTIHNLIEKKKYYDGERISALIIDCGGGTTDLSSCNFVIENDSVSYRVDIETTYENGDTNFGGNNITYRIMQYIKIMFAAFYSQGKSVRIDDIIQVASEDIFRYVDEFGRDAVYEYLEKAYDKAESIIPTKFKNYENRTRDEKSETCTFHIKFNNNELVRSDTVSIFKELTIENWKDLMDLIKKLD